MSGANANAVSELALPENLAKGEGRAPVLSLEIREQSGLRMSFMPFLEGGGLFVPTAREMNIGDAVYLMLTLWDDETLYTLPGKVVWVTPAGSTGRSQGLGIQVARDEAGTLLIGKIEVLLGAEVSVKTATHTI